MVAKHTEYNEAKTVTRSISTPQIYADLVVSALSSNASSYDAGDTITITATIRNQGLRSAGKSSVALTSPDVPAQTKAISSLAAGASATVTYTCTAPQFSSNKTVTVTATADSTGVIPESNENNNTRSTSFTVRSLPDLIVSALTCDKPAYEAGETVTVYATVKNAGATPSGATTVRLTVPGIGTYSKNISALNASASQKISFTFTAPIALTAQSITVTAYADPNNIIQESNENNNTRTAIVAINALRPDIEITDSTITDWYAGLKVTVSATVRNRTAQPVPSAAIRLTIGGTSYTESIPVPGSGSNLAVFKVTVPMAGNYAVRIAADPDGVLNETDESNNILLKDIQVQPVPPSLVLDPDTADMEQGYALYGLMQSPPSVPSTYHTWQEVRLESGSYVIKNYWAKLATIFSVSPDSRIAYSERPKALESGFGYSVSCSTVVTTNYDRPEKLTGAQMVWMRSPESAYGQLSQWKDIRDSLMVKSGNSGDAAVTWQLKANPWSIIGSRLHFVPLWFPDGEYLAWAQAFYGWSPVGQLYDFKTDSLIIHGDMYDRVTTVRWR
jgi:hypothetical protein